MWLIVALSLSVLFQFLTAILAMTLIKRTKTNIAWWLISLGFLIMAIRRLFELFQVYDNRGDWVNSLINSWLGVAISILMLASLSFIKRIFNEMDKIETLKKEKEAQIFSAIIKTEETQKSKFSKELHDGLGPLLSSVKMAISSVVQSSNTEKNSQILINAENVIDESIKTLKEISNNMSPHVLLNYGLLKAIKSFVNRMPENENTEINITGNINEIRFDSTLEFVFYRIACELIINTLKHAKASHVYMDIVHENKFLKLTYFDDGIGFNYNENMDENKGLGLNNIRSRIKSINGSYEIYSKKDEGFKASFTIKTT